MSQNPQPFPSTPEYAAQAFFNFLLIRTITCVMKRARLIYQIH